MPGAPRSLRFCLRSPEKCEKKAPVMQARDRQARVKIKTAGDLVTSKDKNRKQRLCSGSLCRGTPQRRFRPKYIEKTF